MASVDLNTLLHRELSHQIDSVNSPERDGLLVPDYQPFNNIRSLTRIEKRPVTFLEAIKEFLPGFFSRADPFAEYLEHAKRRSEFSPVQDLMIELRQSIALLEAARNFRRHSAPTRRNRCLRVRWAPRWYHNHPALLIRRVDGNGQSVLIWDLELHYPRLTPQRLAIHGGLKSQRVRTNGAVGLSVATSSSEYVAEAQSKAHGGG
jgi:hypothetical protein